MASPFSDNAHSSNPNIQDFYADQPIPPPHRLSTYGSPFSARSTPMNSTTDLTGQGVYAPAGHPGYNSSAYTPMPDSARGSAWLEKQQARSKRSRVIVIVSLIALAAIIVGVAVGVTLTHKHPANLSASGPGSTSGNVTAVPGTNPHDPSNFQKNSALKNSFYGIAYTPNGSIMPQCGATLPDVIEDIQLMSQLTNRIRLYGADCNVTALVLEAIRQTGVNMQIFAGNFLDITDDTAYTRQKAALNAAFQEYGTSNILGVTVGNEVMLNYCTDHNVQPNDPGAAPAANYIISKIQDTRASLKSLGVNPMPLVGNGEAGAFFSNQVLEACDYGLSNVHPWFASVDVQQAAGWTYEYFEETNVQPAALLSNNPQMYIAETGWPTDSTTAAAEVDNKSGDSGSFANDANLQIFLDTFVCAANTNGTRYFYFEFMDEVWKNITYGGVEGYWGLFNPDKTLKNITIPDCSHP